MDLTTGWIEVLAGVASPVFLAIISMFVEALRRRPKPPEKLAWAPGIPIRYVSVGGVKLRYIKAGAGPNLVLLHTLRTQLDIFQKVIPELSREFTVYAPDYPGHGYSDIPKAEYDANFFVRVVEGFLDALNLHDVTLCGVSIGGSICLILAGRRNSRVSRVVAINPYDYAKGRGMARSSLLGWMIVTTSRIPIVGETVMRLRNFIITKAVLNGGVSNRESIPPELLEEMYLVGNQPGHYRAFISLLRNAPSWEAAAKVYGNIIGVPVRLVWGDRDWAKQSERERDKQLIPQAETATIEKGGHFLPLDQPGAVVGQIREVSRSD